MNTQALIEWAINHPTVIINLEDIQLKLKELEFPVEVQSYFNSQRFYIWYVNDIQTELKRFKHLQ